MLRSLSLAAVALFLGLSPTAAEPPASSDLQSLSAYPATVKLASPRAEQHLGVLGEYAGGQRRELTRSARFSSNDSKVVSVDTAGRLRGMANGRATITVEAAGRKATVPVVVEGADDEAPVSFSREVVPVLTRAGCNQGACHGGQHGRGGFKLSLLGFEPEFDHPQIVQSAEGRRVVLSEPERSILLLKPTLSLEHGGGERFKVGSRPYNLLKRWLEDGAPPPSPRDPTVTAIEVWPAKRLMVPGEEQQLLVRATWSDGRTIDVTDVAQFDALNDSVAAVSPSGLILARSSGQTHIMVRYCGQATVAQVTLPSARLNRPLDFPTNNVIDEKLKAKWQELGLIPSPLCSDEEFFRRIHLDAIGTLPAPADIKAFLADRDPDKRKKAIDKVLDRPEFVDFWALKWGDLLRINRDAVSDKGMWSFHNWIRACLRDGKPLDQMAREIITAEGSTFTQGPANYYRLSVGADNQAETTAQLFLGVRMQCAKCHHHAFEKWSQDDYYGMVAFFVRLGSKNSQEFGLFGRESVIYLREAGEASHPRKGGVVKPHALDGPITDDPFDRRRKLAEWMTAKDNPYFARNFANRFWAYFMGRGLVEPIDDMRSTNPPSSPDLLDALAQELVKDKYDLKRFMRTIMNARAYQLSSRSLPGNRADAANTHYTRYTVKRLTAEQLADALDFATGTREKYQGLPPGTRAIQLPDTRVRSFLLDVFGRPPRQITCECERTATPNIAQALHLLNGDFLNRKITAPTGRLQTLLKSKASLDGAIEQLYLVTFSRLPRPEERTRTKEWVARAPSLREGLGDLLWVLVNAREFQFNH
jgi:hypothetical protein